METAEVADPYAQIPAQPVYGDDGYAYQAYGDQGGYAYEPQQQVPYDQYPQYDQQGGQQGGQAGQAYEDPYPQQPQHQPVQDPDQQQYPYPYEPYPPYDQRPDGSPQQ